MDLHLLLLPTNLVNLAQIRSISHKFGRFCFFPQFVDLHPCLLHPRLFGSEWFQDCPAWHLRFCLDFPSLLEMVRFCLRSVRDFLWISRFCLHLNLELRLAKVAAPHGRSQVLTCGGLGPSCPAANDDGCGLPVGCSVRGMLRCFRIENTHIPLLQAPAEAPRRSKSDS